MSLACRIFPLLSFYCGLKSIKKITIAVSHMGEGGGSPAGKETGGTARKSFLRLPFPPAFLAVGRLAAALFEQSPLITRGTQGRFWECARLARN